MSPLGPDNEFTAAAALVDIGANLSHAGFSADLTAVLQRAQAARVETLVLTGADSDSIQRNLDIIDDVEGSTEVPALYATAGVHPHNAVSWNGDLEDQVSAALARTDVVAVGECGFDFNRDFSPRDTQLKAFEAQLEIAARTGKPLFLHERDAHGQMQDVLRSWRDDIPPAVIHCFTGERDVLKGYLDLGMYIGVTGWLCDERRGQSLRECVADIPLDRLMVETDCPYLLPRNLPGKVKGRRHEPALLPWIVTTIAELRHSDEKDLAEATTRTARQFFRLP